MEAAAISSNDHVSESNANNTRGGGNDGDVYVYTPTPTASNAIDDSRVGAHISFNNNVIPIPISNSDAALTDVSSSPSTRCSIGCDEASARTAQVKCIHVNPNKRKLIEAEDDTNIHEEEEENQGEQGEELSAERKKPHCHIVGAADIPMMRSFNEGSAGRGSEQKSSSSNSSSGSSSSSDGRNCGSIQNETDGYHSDKRRRKDRSRSL
jgi:hypothetical protein